MSEHDSKGSGLTRRDLFKGLGTGALAAGLISTEALHPGGSAAAATRAPGVTRIGPGAVPVELQVNGAKRVVHVEPRTTLLGALRDHLDLTGAKLVCDRGSCGACTVHLDGAPVCSCMILALDGAGHEIVTIEGLARGETLAPIQVAFVEHDALQCGFCTPGMVMSCAALLARKPDPTLDDVKHAVAGNLCRCGTYPKVFAATLAAAKSKVSHG